MVPPSRSPSEASRQALKLTEPEPSASKRAVVVDGGEPAASGAQTVESTITMFSLVNAVEL